MENKVDKVLDVDKETIYKWKNGKYYRALR